MSFPVAAGLSAAAMAGRSLRRKFDQYQAKRRRISAAASRITRRPAYQGEKHYVDVQISRAALSQLTANAWELVSAIQQGDGVGNRSGNQIVVTGLHVKYTIYGSQASSYSAVQNRIVVDTQTNGDAYAATDLDVADTVQSLPNQDNRDRFRIVKKWFTEHGAANALGYQIVDKFIPMKVPIRYKSNTGLIADLPVNSLWYVTNCVFATTGPATVGAIRVYFDSN